MLGFSVGVAVLGFSVGTGVLGASVGSAVLALSVGVGEGVAVGSPEVCAELFPPQAVKANVKAAIAAMAGNERCFSC